MTTKREQDGGYYAIKGFTYQFDKTLLEIVDNQTKEVELEYIQDIGVNGYYIQVKYKETQNFTDSKIKPAILQLLKCFIEDKSKKYKLYCYFKDKTPRIDTLTETRLDNILGAESVKYGKDNKKDFLNNFTLEFSDNYEMQFRNLIKCIKDNFKLKSIEEATVYHAIFKANLLDIAIRKDPKKRRINYEKLKQLTSSSERIIFDIAYFRYLKLNRYLKHIKGEYFTFKKINIPNRERLFIIEVDTLIRDTDIIDVVEHIQNKYFKKNISPAPYVCLCGIDDKRIVGIKHKIWDKKLVFHDGTNFNGDKFRLGDLIIDTHNNNSKIKIKFISFEKIDSLLNAKIIDETFIFFTSGNLDWRTKTEGFREFYIERTKNITKIIN